MPPGHLHEGVQHAWALPVHLRSARGLHAQGVIQVGTDTVPDSIDDFKSKRTGNRVKLSFLLKEPATVTYKLTGKSRRTVRLGRLAAGRRSFTLRRLKPGTYRGVLTVVDDFDKKVTPRNFSVILTCDEATPDRWAGRASRARALQLRPSAKDPGRWTLSGWSSVPNPYWQGVSSAGRARRCSSPASLQGSTAPTRRCPKRALRTPSFLPRSRRSRATTTWGHRIDGADGERVLLPLECYSPAVRTGQRLRNRCDRHGGPERRLPSATT